MVSGSKNDGTPSGATETKYDIGRENMYKLNTYAKQIMENIVPRRLYYAV